MSKSKESPFVLVDGSSYLFRAYYALPPLTNAAGMPTGAIYGVLNMLRKLIKDYGPSNMAVVFDPKGKTTRHKIFPDYKANRAAMPEELAAQILPLHKAISALGMPLVIQPGIEADDLIGTLAKQAEQQGYQVVISTGDKDMAQLVNQNITLINTMNNKKYNMAGVKEKYGVAPECIIDYLALMGDTSDNIPGVEKVGPKTAVKWLSQYGSLDNVVAHAQAFTGKVGEYLRVAIAEKTLELSRQLVTIDCDIELPDNLKPDQLCLLGQDNQVLKSLFAELEFSKWLADLDHNEETVGAPEPAQYETLLSESEFLAWMQRLEKASVISFDTETTHINAMRAQLVGLSFSDAPGQAAYVPLAHDGEDGVEQLDMQWVLAQLRPILQDPNKTVVGQNLKYDIQILRHYDMRITAKMWDTMLASYVLNAQTARHDMDTLARQCLGRETIKFEDVAGKGAKQLTFNQVAIPLAAQYAAEDADITLQLYHYFLPQLESTWAGKIFTTIEMPLMPILAEMEYAGVCIDVDMLAEQSEDLAGKIATIQKEVFSLADEEFNIASPKQLQAILFDKLALPIIKKTPKGQPSTAEEVLAQLALDYPLPKLILEYRSLSKLKSTYTDRLPEQVNPKTGRVHTHYNQTVTSTGRLSSNEPNLQNIPVRNTQGRKIRQAFVARASHKILAADYSQVELRIMAHFSQDPNLLSAFANNIDVHSATAAEVFGVKVADVTSEQRRSAKAINFGLIYGMSAFGLARQLGVPRSDAQHYIDTYFDRYPKVKAYMEQARESAATKGYVETLFERRLFTPDIRSKNAIRRKAAERAAINAPLQGSAADIIKCAMINSYPWIQSRGSDVRLLMQVHDELVFSVADSVVDEAKQKIREYMQGAVELSVELVVEIGVAVNWEAAH